MIRLTIYRLGATIEIDFNTALPEDLKDLRSGKIYTLEHTSEGKTESIRFRPYYRRTIGGILNIFAEEEVDLRN